MYFYGIVAHAPPSTSVQLELQVCARPHASVQAFVHDVISQSGVFVQPSAQWPPGQSSRHDCESEQLITQLAPHVTAQLVPFWHSTLHPPPLQTMSQLPLVQT